MISFCPYYLYFFDRELLTSLDFYDRVHTTDLYSDALMSILTTPFQCYFACSVLFESRHAESFFRQYTPLFTEGLIFLTISGAAALTPWIREKQYHYRMDNEKRYRNYFSDFWKKVQDTNPRIIRKHHSTTTVLHSRMLDDLSNRKFSVVLPAAGGEHLQPGMASLAPRLSDSIEARVGRAVTKKLFEPVFVKTKASLDIRQAFNLMVSFAYVSAHLDEWGGTVPMNGRVPIRLFDHFSHNYPLSDLSVWENIYRKLGVYNLLMGLRAIDICLLKDSPVFSEVLRVVKDFMEAEPLALHDPRIPSLPKPRGKSSLAQILDRFKRLLQTEWPYELKVVKRFSRLGGHRMQRHRDKVDVLLITANTVEAKAVRGVAKAKTGQKSQVWFTERKTYDDLGTVGSAKVCMVRAEMGTSGPGAALSTALTAIKDVSPSCVILVGIAFGIDSRRQNIGDILLSKQLQAYDIQRVGTDKAGNVVILPRGDRVTASTKLLGRFRNAELDWGGASLQFGLILSGDKLVDNKRFKKGLLDFEPEAIGGEMECAGVYTAAHDENVDWIMVKAIGDWADGLKSVDEDEHQTLAARNAAEFVFHALSQGGFAGDG